MELPIQLKFFRKIELYQEYKFEERKAADTRLVAWSIEKQILKWTVNNHHHLASPLTKDRINRDMLDTKHSAELTHALYNLIQRKYAEGDPEQGITITKEGLLIGEVINEVDGKVLSRFKYPLFFSLVWLTAISGAFIVIINFLKLIHPLFKPLFSWILGLSIC